MVDAARPGLHLGFLSMLLTVSQGNRALLRIDGEQSALIANICFRDQADLRAQLWHTTAHLDSVSVAHWSMWFNGIHDTIWRELPADSKDRRRTVRRAPTARGACATWSLLLRAGRWPLGESSNGENVAILCEYQSRPIRTKKSLLQLVDQKFLGLQFLIEHSLKYGNVSVTIILVYN